MSTKEMILQIQSLPLTDRLIVIEEILKSIQGELQPSKSSNQNDVRRRRKSFKVKAFDLGGNVVIDRDEIYSERGI